MNTSSILDEAIDWLKTLIIAVIIALILRSFVISPFKVSLTSMYPTLYPDDLILVEKISMRFSPIKQGEIIVFRSPLGERKDFVKRVIAVPGDKIESREGDVYVNDELIQETYLKQNFSESIVPQTVIQGEYFVMGDNRDNSLDSRNFGTIEAASIKGRVVIIFWPWFRWQVLAYNRNP
ncbi:MAG: Signal peptidase I T [candidate division WS2 bacterium]|uniref:Signal peptidase I n=1 Tax=Psychracetigena formicireducens TaxID=2986056 RepID=A0A9E2BF59_PSYF1|nr:Signal peptidase I T [Candidatus Psychracetigena formicireducens]MBT9144483.1 Signal peptidase I T [Candidatus Psychracetigena formicireducens]MBT9149979.1 Signal peptidase I T [Candidatus Psychracetigena formicireducens]